MIKDVRTPWYRRLIALAELAGDHEQQDIAAALGVSPSTVTAWKQGTPPSPEAVKAAARAYQTDVMELLRIAFVDDDPKAKAPKKGTHIRISGPNGQTPL